MGFTTISESPLGIILSQFDKKLKELKEKYRLGENTEQNSLEFIYAEKQVLNLIALIESINEQILKPFDSGNKPGLQGLLAIKKHIDEVLLPKHMAFFKKPKIVFIDALRKDFPEMVSKILEKFPAKKKEESTSLLFNTINFIRNKQSQGEPIEKEPEPSIDADFFLEKFKTYLKEAIRQNNEIQFVELDMIPGDFQNLFLKKLEEIIDHYDFSSWNPLFSDSQEENIACFIDSVAKFIDDQWEQKSDYALNITHPLSYELAIKLLSLLESYQDETPFDQFLSFLDPDALVMKPNWFHQWEFALSSFSMINVPLTSQDKDESQPEHSYTYKITMKGEKDIVFDLKTIFHSFFLDKSSLLAEVISYLKACQVNKDSADEMTLALLEKISREQMVYEDMMRDPVSPDMSWKENLDALTAKQNELDIVLGEFGGDTNSTKNNKDNAFFPGFVLLSDTEKENIEWVPLRKKLLNRKEELKDQYSKILEDAIENEFKKQDDNIKTIQNQLENIKSNLTNLNKENFDRTPLKNHGEELNYLASQKEILNKIKLDLEAIEHNLNLPQPDNVLLTASPDLANLIKVLDVLKIESIEQNNKLGELDKENIKAVEKAKKAQEFALKLQGSDKKVLEELLEEKTKSSEEIRQNIKALEKNGFEISNKIEKENATKIAYKKEIKSLKGLKEEHLEKGMDLAQNLLVVLQAIDGITEPSKDLMTIRKEIDARINGYKKLEESFSPVEKEDQKDNQTLILYIASKDKLEKIYNEFVLIIDGISTLEESIEFKKNDFKKNKIFVENLSIDEIKNAKKIKEEKSLLLNHEASIKMLGYIIELFNGIELLESHMASESLNIKRCYKTHKALLNTLIEVKKQKKLLSNFDDYESKIDALEIILDEKAEAIGNLNAKIVVANIKSISNEVDSLNEDIKSNFHNMDMAFINACYKRHELQMDNFNNLKMQVNRLWMKDYDQEIKEINVKLDNQQSELTNHLETISNKEVKTFDEFFTKLSKELIVAKSSLQFDSKEKDIASDLKQLSESLSLYIEKTTIFDEKEKKFKDFNDLAATLLPDNNKIKVIHNTILLIKEQLKITSVLTETLTGSIEEKNKLLDAFLEKMPLEFDKSEEKYKANKKTIDDLELLLTQIPKEQISNLINKLKESNYSDDSLLLLLEDIIPKFDNLKKDLADSKNKNTEVENHIHERKNKVGSLKEHLRLYHENRGGRFYFKDRISPQDAIAHGLFIARLNDELDTYGRTGDSQPIFDYLKIESAKFKGQYLPPLLNRLKTDLRTEDKRLLFPENPVDEQAEEMSAKAILLTLTGSQFKQSAELIKNLKTQIQKMDNYGLDLALIDRDKGTLAQNLARELQTKVDEFLISHQESLKPDNNDENYKFGIPRADKEQFFEEFKDLLHSQDDAMNQHRESWKPIVLNVLIALCSLGTALAWKAYSSKKEQGYVSFFFDKTKRMQMVDQVDEALLELEGCVPVQV